MHSTRTHSLCLLFYCLSLLFRSPSLFFPRPLAPALTTCQKEVSDQISRSCWKIQIRHQHTKTHTNKAETYNSCLLLHPSIQNTVVNDRICNGHKQKEIPRFFISRTLLAKNYCYCTERSHLLLLLLLLLPAVYCNG